VHATAAATAPYFFLSYAHGAHEGSLDDGELDYWVSEFFRDLCRSVEQRAGLAKGMAPGFMERDRRMGEDWPTEVIRALATCHVFVPLYSSRYFADEDCGKEWNFFAGRLPDPTAQETTIVPGIWDPVDPGRLPKAARVPPVTYHGIKAYESLGLYGIMKVSRYRGEYARVVSELARGVLAAADRSPVKDRLDVDYRTLQSAFSPAGVALGSTPEKRVRITVVAPGRDELPDGRSNASVYGSSALEWKPYAPGSVRPIAEEAARLARSLEYWAEVGDLGQHEEDLLSGDPRSGPQILIIDPWALLVPHSQQLLRQLDARRLPWVQVVIPWSSSDDETRKAEGKLRVALDETLRHKLAEVASTSAMAAHGVPRPDDFDLVLRQLIGTAAKKYLGHAAAYPPRGEAVERPRIS
jgi:FxsC-like protein